MIIYEATKDEFLNHVLEDSIVEEIETAYKKNNLSLGNKNEIRSWQNSFQYMHKVLATDEIPGNCGVAIEFKIPLTSKRIDFIISGFDENNKGNVIIVELKQWSGKDTSRLDSKDGLIKTYVGGGFRETLHPSYQAWSYSMFIRDFNESVQDRKIELYPCAYLHNYDVQFKEELDNTFYHEYVLKAPIYLKGDAIKLREFIKNNIKLGDDKLNLYEINSGKIRPSKSLQDLVASMIKGNKEFILLDSQKIVYENALDLALKSFKDDKKRVMIVEGGPGTGKSVVAINLLSELIQKGLVAQYVSKNSAPRNIYRSKLRGSFKTQNIDHLFRGSGSFVNKQKNSFDTLIVDEAHRLNEKSGMYKNQGENQINEIIFSSKFSIFFIDENQKIDIFDIGSKDEIIRFAKQNKAEIFEFELDSQFRCNGSDGYLAWLDDVLQIRKTANEEGFDLNYDIQIFDSPDEMHSKIVEKNKLNNKSRTVAGYCWNWDKNGKSLTNVKDIKIDSFEKSWNLNNTATWAIDKTSVNEIGCIHTCQGLEFDFVGVIFGLDLRYDEGKIITDYTQRAKTDQSLKGIKSLAAKNEAEAEKIADIIIKNTYRTLMTRGMKGCYIYCCDKNLSSYLKERLSFKK